MVIARIVGGLGNQLFIYAAARRMALANNVPLRLDVESGFKWDVVYKRKYLLHQFNIKAETASPWESCVTRVGRIRRYFLRRINKTIPFKNRFYITEESQNFDPRILRYKVRRKVYLEGYWQSEKYFKDIEDVIRKDFQIATDFDSVTLSEAEMISKKNSVCIGVRRFQEEINSTKFLLGMEYYQKAIEIMVQEVPDAHFFIITEDPEWALKNFKIRYPFTLISHKVGNERAYENLWLMSLCKHFIISQGTYHWWGAWLSTNPDKKVIAPASELVNTSEDYIPDDWTKIGV